METAEAHEALRKNLADLRSTIETRHFENVEELLLEQRQLFEQLDLSQQDSKSLFTEATDLNRWALNFTHIHHAKAEEAFAALLKTKQVNTGYFAASKYHSADLLNVRG